MNVAIRLWAPAAHSAEVVLTDRRVPMALESPGHWVAWLAPGTDYLLSVDGGTPRPDPRSAHQPFGVHGPSRVFDTNAFQWSDADWAGRDVLGSVIYELHIGTFTPDGTLDAAIDRLDHLVQLGVDVVELLPVAAFPGDHGWGYDGVSWFAVHEAYGGPAALQRFVDAAHAKGLGVCLDVVYNHFGPDGNYTAEFAPYTRSGMPTPWGDAMNLYGDDSAGVREFICDNALRWIDEFHIDALRLDAVHALLDTSEEHILAELSRRVQEFSSASGRKVSLIAESLVNDARTVQPLAAGGMGMTAEWDDDVHHAIHALLTGERFGYYVDFGTPEALSKALEQVFVHDGSWSTFRAQHWGTPIGPEVDRRHYIAYTQDHDQIGNRALGDRPDATLPSGAVAGGAALVLLSSFTPMLFQGQEWGSTTPFLFFTDHTPELGQLVTKGRLAEFARHDWDLTSHGQTIPDPQDPETFRRSKLDWTDLEAPDHQAMLAWYHRLIALRREFLADSGAPVRTDHRDGWFRMVNGPLTVIVNLQDSAARLAEARDTVDAAWGQVEVAEGVVELGPHAVVVLQD